MSQGSGPTYSLTTIQEMVRRGDYLVTKSGQDGASRLSLDIDDIESCVLALDETDFHKTMPSRQMQGLMQDVYKPTYEGYSLYVKLQVGNFGRAVVISFKGDESR